MHCPQCQTDNPEQARFCLQCGARLAVTCPSCGTELPPDARFCFHCGATLAATTPESPPPSITSPSLPPTALAEAAEDRRLVTVLFADLVGFTAMSERLDPEQVQEIQQAYFETVTKPIQDHGGVVEKYIGDAVLAVFGVPEIHEDDPERAIHAALAMQEVMGDLNQRLEATPSLKLRIGINTGLVIARMATDSDDFIVTGDTVNLASRLQSAAPTGGVLIAHDSYRHVRGVFDVAPQEPLTVKGKNEPILTYLVQVAKPRAWRVGSRGVEGIETRMVGRDGELLILQGAFRDAMEGSETRLVVVTGEAGIGKSRLLNEFSSWAELLPERYFYFKGRAYPITSGMPYHLWRDIFAYRFAILESDPAPVVLEKFRQGMAGILEPEQADLVGQLVGFDLVAGGSQAAAALLGSPSFSQVATAYLVSYFRQLLAQQPVMILGEDLQWADDRSLDLITHLAEKIPDAPLFLLGATRLSLFERRPGWGEGQEGVTVLSLRSLSRRASRTLVDEILQKMPVVTEELRTVLVEGADGNPFYVEELVKMLVEERVIVTGDGGAQTDAWQVNLERLAQTHLPPTLTALLQARLDSLQREEREVLQRAAVVGRQFWDALVQELSGDGAHPQAIGPALETLRDRELVFRREQSAFAGSHEYTFKHGLLRDVAYETVLLRLRRRYHGQVARWLEQNAGERLGEYLGLIAEHYEMAGEGEQAAAYWSRSGQEVFRVGAYQEALSLAQRGLRLLPPTGAEEVKAKLLVQSGEALMRLGEFQEAEQSFQECLDLAQEAGDLSRETWARAGLGEMGWRQGRWQESRRHLEAGLALAQHTGERRALAWLYDRMGHLCHFQGDVGDGFGWAEKALTLYDELGDRQGEMIVLNLMGILAEADNDIKLRKLYFGKSLEIAREIGDRRGTAVALANLGAIWHQPDQMEEARSLTRQANAIFEEIGDRQQAEYTSCYIGVSYLKQGENAVAWPYLERSLSCFADMGDFVHCLEVTGWIGALYLHQGDGQRAAELVGLTLRHPATSSENERYFAATLEELRQALPADELETAMTRGASRDLDDVIAEVLARPHEAWTQKQPGAVV